LKKKVCVKTTSTPRWKGEKIKKAGRLEKGEKLPKGDFFITWKRGPEKYETGKARARQLLKGGGGGSKFRRNFLRPRKEARGILGGASVGETLPGGKALDHKSYRRSLALRGEKQRNERREKMPKEDGWGAVLLGTSG